MPGHVCFTVFLGCRDGRGACQDLLSMPWSKTAYRTRVLHIKTLWGNALWCACCLEGSHPACVEQSSWVEAVEILPVSVGGKNIPFTRACALWSSSRNCSPPPWLGVFQAATPKGLLICRNAFSQASVLSWILVCSTAARISFIWARGWLQRAQYLSYVTEPTAFGDLGRKGNILPPGGDYKTQKCVIFIIIWWFWPCSHERHM